MSDFDCDLVGIGSGAIGQRAAVQATKLRRRTVVVERGHSIWVGSVDTTIAPARRFGRGVFLTMGRGPINQRRSDRIVAYAPVRRHSCQDR